MLYDVSFSISVALSVKRTPVKVVTDVTYTRKSKKIAQKNKLKFGSSKNSCTFASAIGN